MLDVVCLHTQQSEKSAEWCCGSFSERANSSCPVSGLMLNGGQGPRKEESSLLCEPTVSTVQVSSTRSRKRLKNRVVQKNEREEKIPVRNNYHSV